MSHDKSSEVNLKVNESHNPIDLAAQTAERAARKAELRRSLLKTRQALSQAIWRENSDRLCTHLQNAALFTQSQTILAYFSFRQEPDLSSLFSTSHCWGFPRSLGKSLSWHVWSPESGPLQTGTYGIPEPPPTAPVLMPSEVDLILVPAVACDERGHRLGYGGGFYDRLLSSPAWAAKPTIGIVFEFARFPHLPIDSWDHPLQGVCTEAGLFWSKQM